MERKYLIYHTGLGFTVGIISFLVIIFIVVNLVFALTEHPILQLLVIAGGSGAVIISSFYADKWSQQHKWQKNSSRVTDGGSNHAERHVTKFKGIFRQCAVWTIILTIGLPILFGILALILINLFGLIGMGLK